MNRLISHLARSARVREFAHYRNGMNGIRLAAPTLPQLVKIKRKRQGPSRNSRRRKTP